VVEYATLAGSLAAMFASLSIVTHSVQIPLTSAGARAMAVATARSHGVPGSRGKAAYASAPFRKPALRYLYSVGWVGAASNVPACKAAVLLGDPNAAASEAVRQSPELLARLRTAHITARQASAAVARGFEDGCR
jgi:hypothetical protein